MARIVGVAEGAVEVGQALLVGAGEIVELVEGIGAEINGIAEAAQQLGALLHLRARRGARGRHEADEIAGSERHRKDRGGRVEVHGARLQGSRRLAGLQPAQRDGHQRRPLAVGLLFPAAREGVAVIREAAGKALDFAGDAPGFAVERRGEIAEAAIGIVAAGDIARSGRIEGDHLQRAEAGIAHLGIDMVLDELAVGRPAVNVAGPRDGTGGAVRIEHGDAGRPVADQRTKRREAWVLAHFGHRLLLGLAQRLERLEEPNGSPTVRFASRLRTLRACAGRRRTGGRRGG